MVNFVGANVMSVMFLRPPSQRYAQEQRSADLTNTPKGIISLMIIGMSNPPTNSQPNCQGNCSTHRVGLAQQNADDHTQDDKESLESFDKHVCLEISFLFQLEGKLENV